jgi:pilus assembly protein CpaE
MKTLVILDNFDIQQSIINALTASGIETTHIIPCSYKDAGLFIKDASIQLVLLEVGPNVAAALQFTDFIKGSNPIAKIVPIIHNKDSDLILQLIKRGIADVLVTPIDAAELKEITKKISYSPEFSGKPAGGHGGFKGKIVTCTSYKGGTGVSTIAANLGFCLAELDAVKKKTLILDLANQSNHCALLLSAQPTISINQICKDVTRMESAFIFSSCAWLGPNLAIIGTDPDLGGVEALEFESLKKALDLFTESFEYVVIDLPTHTFDSRFLASIDKANQILVVSTIDITSIRDTRLYLNMLRSLGADNSKLRLLINRYDCESGMFKTKDLEQALQNAISFYVPNDFRTMTEASQSGEAVLELRPNSMIAEAIAELAIGIDNGAMFVPPKVESKKKAPIGGLGGLLSNLKK